MKKTYFSLTLPFLAISANLALADHHSKDESQGLHELEGIYAKHAHLQTVHRIVQAVGLSVAQVSVNRLNQNGKNKIRNGELDEVHGQDDTDV